MTGLRQQTVVIVAGAPGAGKSTVAAQLAAALGAAEVDLDAVFEPVAPLLAGQAPEAVRTAIYESLVAIAEAALPTGAHVVVSAPFTRERRDPRAWEALSERLSAGGAEVVLVWLHAPPESLLARLAARGEARDSGKLADPDAWLREVEPDAPPCVPHIAVDATQPAADAAVEILRGLVESEGAREACSCSA